MACCFPAHKFRHPIPRVVSRLRLGRVHGRVGTVTTTGVRLRRRLTGTRRPIRMRSARRIIVASAGVTPHAMFFGVNSSGLSPRRRVGLSCLTDGVGRSPGTACAVGKCTSSTANAPTFGRGLDLRHTRIIGSLLIGGCNVSTSELGITTNNNISGFNRPVLGHMMLIRSTRWSCGFDVQQFFIVTY